MTFSPASVGMMETAQVEERSRGNGASQTSTARRGVQIVDDEPQTAMPAGGCCTSGWTHLHPFTIPGTDNGLFRPPLCKNCHFPQLHLSATALQLCRGFALTVYSLLKRLIYNSTLLPADFRGEKMPDWPSLRQIITNRYQTITPNLMKHTCTDTFP